MGIKKQLVITSLLSTAAVLGGCDLLGNKDVKKAKLAGNVAEKPKDNNQGDAETILVRHVEEAVLAVRHRLKREATEEANNQDGDKTAIKERLENDLGIANKGKTRVLRSREKWSNREMEATEEVDKEECREEVENCDIALHEFEDEIKNIEGQLNEINESQ
ncbi:MAG: hypothetical protein EU981_05030 [Candidatus Liberibacter ctenarytainae]|uniref:Lipoprotein n=1 Tax=Candidatus Liberibacter ctenarytainae TaxID=2020335 RepID=A0A937DMD6_9HYPH|nr:hypothetical protein [Candidatus Liberibacter ctenarytainae]